MTEFISQPSSHSAFTSLCPSISVQEAKSSVLGSQELTRVTVPNEMPDGPVSSRGKPSNPREVVVRNILLLVPMAWVVSGSASPARQVQIEHCSAAGANNCIPRCRGTQQ